MGKTSKWIRNFLIGKKDREKDQRERDKLGRERERINPVANQLTPLVPTNAIPIPPTTPREKRRWSFRRSAASAAAPLGAVTVGELKNEQKKHTMAVAAATAAAAMAVVQAAASVIRLTAVTGGSGGRGIAIEEAAAIKIQSTFRAYLVCVDQILNFYLYTSFKIFKG